MNKKNLDEIRELLEARYQYDSFTRLQQLPTPDNFKDIQKATIRIIDAIKKAEKITIVGDYDADGVVSTAIMVIFFQKVLGVAVDYIIPNRFIHGYGLSPKIVEQIDSGLVITVDNGISAYEAALLCKEKGLDLIITDHHTVGEEIPEAYAIVNPKQIDCSFPFSDICGANVAWYLCAGIKQGLKIDFNLMELLDLLVIAIVADVMPMKSINKSLVKNGLKCFEYSQRTSLLVLKNRLNLSSITETDIGFKIAPLINCAGRMEDGMLALEFLLEEDFDRASVLLDYLINLNEQRKNEQLLMFENAKKQVSDSGIVVVEDTDWNEGIIGIVASKLCEKYKKPAFVFKNKGDFFKGSARSLGDIHLYELIDSVKEYTINFGGHKGAAGLSVAKNDFLHFKKALEENIHTMKQHPIEYAQTFCEIGLELVDNELFELIESYRPYGLENTLPLFYFNNLTVVQIYYIGSQKQYKKIVLSDGNITRELLVFSDEDQFFENEMISFSASIEKNCFRDRTTYNLLLKELYKY